MKSKLVIYSRMMHNWIRIHVYYVVQELLAFSLTDYGLDWPQSLMPFFFSKTDTLSKIAIYKLYLEVEVLRLDISKFDYQRG